MIMYSNEDLERFYFQYQTEALPHGLSVEQFCLRNKVPYNIFYKWYKDTRRNIVEVQVDGKPSDVPAAEKPAGPADAPTNQRPPTKTRILVDIRVTNGLHVTQKNLSYQDLKQLVEKLEGLC